MAHDKADPLYEAFLAAADVAEAFTRVARDPFKAPEVVMAVAVQLQTKLYETHVQHAAMLRQHGA